MGDPAGHNRRDRPAQSVRRARSGHAIERQHESLGIAIASTVAASHTNALLHAGHAAPTALTGGFQAAFLVLGAIGLIAVPAIFTLVRRDELTDAVAKTAVHEPQPALAGAK